MTQPHRSSQGQRMSAGLVALGSAAVFAVYAAGFLRTEAAAEAFDEADARRRPATPTSTSAGSVEAPTTASERPAPTPPAAAASAPSDAVALATPKPAATVTLALPTTPANRTPAPVSPGAPSPVAEVRPTAASVSVATAPTATAPTTASPAAEMSSVAPTAAVAMTAAPAAAPAPVVGKFKDGTYTGWGSCRHGDIQAQVVVESGRIVSASVAQCLTRWTCSWISPLPPQVPARQSAEVDYVTGATQSAIAFYNALVDALAKAKP